MNDMASASKSALEPGGKGALPSRQSWEGGVDAGLTWAPLSLTWASLVLSSTAYEWG